MHIDNAAGAATPNSLRGGRRCRVGGDIGSDGGHAHGIGADVGTATDRRGRGEIGDNRRVSDRIHNRARGD